MNRPMIFGKPVSLWRSGCGFHPGDGAEPEPFVNLYVRVTNGCNASCAFCCNSGSDKNVSFDMEKFVRVLDGIIRSGIRLNRITLTGGEPSTRPERVRMIVDAIAERPGCHFTQVQLHTNGLSARSRRLIALRRIDTVSISFHHYDLRRLSEIYGCPVPDGLLDFDSGLRRKINLSCNLIKGAVDSPEHVAAILEAAASKGFGSVGFAGLMRLDAASRALYVDPWTLGFDRVPRLTEVGRREHESACRCRNYIYSGCNGPVGVYVRETTDTSYCRSSLLFDGAFLRQGFGDDNVII